MSKNSKPKLLTPGEVSKKILRKPKKIECFKEWIDNEGKNREQRVAHYNQKKNEFLATAKAYNRMNLDTLMCPKERLHDDYENMLNLDFLKEIEQPQDCDPLCCCLKCTPNETGRVLKQRSLRHITEITEPKIEVFTKEAWFKRYLILNKFIWAARTVIIQNRLLKVLDKLKELNIKKINAIEESIPEKKCEDYHCHPVFLKFL